jgi:toxic protein SymE
METKDIKHPTNTRTLKLQPLHSPRAHNTSREVPKLILSGVWLEQSGFKIGKMVQVIVKDKELTIKTN